MRPPRPWWECDSGESSGWQPQHSTCTHVCTAYTHPPMRLAKGCTTREVPITSSRSQVGKSYSCTSSTYTTPRNSTNPARATGQLNLTPHHGITASRHDVLPGIWHNTALHARISSRPSRIKAVRCQSASPAQVCPVYRTLSSTTT